MVKAKIKGLTLHRPWGYASEADKFVKELLTATQPVFGEPVSLSPKRVEGMVLALDKVLTGWPATTLAKTYRSSGPTPEMTQAYWDK